MKGKVNQIAKKKKNISRHIRDFSVLKSRSFVVQKTGINFIQF